MVSRGSIQPGPATPSSVLLTHTWVVQKPLCCHQGLGLLPSSPFSFWEETTPQTRDSSDDQGDLHLSDCQIVMRMITSHAIHPSRCGCTEGQHSQPVLHLGNEAQSYQATGGSQRYRLEIRGVPAVLPLCYHRGSSGWRCPSVPAVGPHLGYSWGRHLCQARWGRGSEPHGDFIPECLGSR